MHRQIHDNDEGSHCRTNILPRGPNGRVRGDDVVPGICTGGGKRGANQHEYGQPRSPEGGKWSVNPRADNECIASTNQQRSDHKDEKSQRAYVFLCAEEAWEVCIVVINVSTLEQQPEIEVDKNSDTRKVDYRRQAMTRGVYEEGKRAESVDADNNHDQDLHHQDAW